MNEGKKQLKSPFKFLDYYDVDDEEIFFGRKRETEILFNDITTSRLVVLFAKTGTGKTSLINAGVDESSARNTTLLLMVLFQNIMVGNCRSETKTALKLNPFKNRNLLFGTLGAQLIHIGALYTPGLREILGVAPVSLDVWIKLLAMSLSVFVAVEIYKWVRERAKLSSP